MISSQDIEFFIIIAGSRSLAAAARKLNVTPPSVSQRLQSIERKLGVKLVERSARSISLTDEGELLAKKGEVLLQDLEALQQEISDKNRGISGEIRLVSPIGLAVKHIGPIVAEFQQQYPLVNIELNLSDNPKWAAHHSPDIMFYIGHLQDSSLKRIVLAKNRRLLLASPEYLQASPVLANPEDLEQHRCIALRENDEDATMWRFTETSTRRTTSVRVLPVLSSNVGQITKDWCLQGKGIIQRSEWDVQSELNSGDLVHLLPSYRLPAADIVALLSSEQFNRSRKISIFLDFTKKRLVERMTLSARFR